MRSILRSPLLLVLLGVLWALPSAGQSVFPGTLPTGCTNGQIAIYNTTTQVWACGNNGGGGGGTPGGSSGQVQWNNAGSFGGITGATTNGTALTLVAPVLGTPASGTLTNTTGFPVANLAGAGTGVLTALAVNVGSAGAPVVFNGALGTPSSGTATNLTGLPLTSGVTGRLPYANLVAPTTTSLLLGRNASTTGDWQEITVGSGLTLTGTTLSASGGGSGALSALTAAVASNTIANGDNPQVWNWATTTSGQIGQTFGETTASTSAGTPYLVKFNTLIGSTASPVNISNSLNGSQTLPALSITPTWNTTGVARGLEIALTNTASNSASKVFGIKIGSDDRFVVRTGASASATNPTIDIGNLGIHSGFYSRDVSGAFSTSWVTTMNGGYVSELWTGGAFILTPAWSFAWSSTSTAGSAVDTMITRKSAGLVEVNNGSTCTSSVANCRDLISRHSFASGSVPTVSNTSANSCGTTAATIAGADEAGAVTVGATSGTSCTVTFATAYTNAPACHANNDTGGAPLNVVTTTTTAVISGTFAASDKLKYTCRSF